MAMTNTQESCGTRQKHIVQSYSKTKMTSQRRHHNDKHAYEFLRNHLPEELLGSVALTNSTPSSSNSTSLTASESSDSPPESPKVPKENEIPVNQKAIKFFYNVLCKARQQNYKLDPVALSSVGSYIKDDKIKLLSVLQLLFDS